MFKVNNEDTRRHWRRSGVAIVNFKHISHLVLVFLLLTLNKYTGWEMFSVSISLSLPYTDHCSS